MDEPAEKARTVSSNPGDERTAAIGAVASVLEALSAFMIRNGIGYREANELLKDALVRSIERDEFSIKSGESNISRIAVLTGLSRKEVSRLRGRLAESQQPAKSTLSLPARLLATWAHDKRFNTESGEPVLLSYPEGSPRFSDLLRAVGADIPPKAIIRELVRCGSVVWMGETKLRLVRQSYRPLASDDYNSVRFGECVRDLQNTLLANMRADAGSARLLERRAWHDKLPVGSLEHFHALVRTLAEGLLADADSWLTLAGPSPSNASDLDEENEETTRVGVGIYVFEGE